MPPHVGSEVSFATGYAYAGYLPERTVHSQSWAGICHLLKDLLLLHAFKKHPYCFVKIGWLLFFNVLG